MAILAVASAALSSCDDDKLYTTDYEETTLPKEVVMNVSEILPVGVGEDTTVTYQVLPLDFPDREVAFLTSNPAIATVDPDGTIHGVSVGEATITCTLPIGFGPKSTVVVNVIPEVVRATGLTLENTTDLGEEGKIYVTDELQLKGNIEPVNHTYDRLVWMSSDENIATVDENGLVKCLALGDVTISAVTTDRSAIVASYPVHIEPYIAVESITIAPVEDPIGILSGDYTLDVTYTPAQATKGSVEWTSSDESVATVHRGIVTPTGFGSATITGTCVATGEKVSVNIEIPAGWYVWDASNAFTGFNKQTSWISNNEAPNIEDGVWRVHFPDAATNTGKWRRDIKLNCSNNDLIPFHSGYPVFAMRTTLQKGGNNTLDARIGNPKCNDGIELPDGSRMIYWVLSNHIADWSGYHDFNLFQIKLADIPNGNVDRNKAYYDIYWCRTFKSLEEATAFANQDATDNPQK